MAFFDTSRRVIYDRKVTWLAGVQISQPANLRGYSLRGIIVPAGWVGTTMTFKASPTELSNTNTGAASDVYDNTGAQVSITVAPSRYIVFDQAVSEKLNALGDNIIIVGNATQLATTTLTLVCVASTK